MLVGDLAHNVNGTALATQGKHCTACNRSQTPTLRMQRLSMPLKKPTESPACFLNNTRYIHMKPVRKCEISSVYNAKVHRACGVFSKP